MVKPIPFTQVEIDANRKTSFLLKSNGELRHYQYATDPRYKAIVDNTVYLTKEEIEESQRMTEGTTEGTWHDQSGW